MKEIEADQAKARISEQPLPEPPKIIKPASFPLKKEKPVEPAPPPTPPNLIYGQEIFKNNSIGVYQKTEELVAPDTYVLGIGDKIGVIGFGRSQFEQVLEINNDGFVLLGNNLPKVLLKGIRLGDAPENYSSSAIANTT